MRKSYVALKEAEGTQTVGARNLPDLSVSRAPMAEQVVFKLLTHIRTGNLKAGDRLPPERELVELIGVSRPTLREALRALTILGAIRARQGGGLFVSSLSPQELLAPLQFFLTLKQCDVETLYDARSLIEGGLARRAAQHATNADVTALRELIRQQDEKLTDPEAYRHLDVAFHERIHSVAKNPFLARAATSLNVLGMQFRKLASETPAVIRGSLRDHAAVVDALAEHDGPAAEQAMQDHMHRVLVTTQKGQSARRRSEVK